MQWSEVLAQLPPATAATLVNGLTIGCGQAALAGRRAAQDARVTAVERALVAALVAWSRSIALLPDALRRSWVAPVLPDPALPSALPVMTWRQLLAHDDPGTLTEALADVLGAAHRAVALVVADADVADTLAQLTAVVAAASALRARLLTLAQDHVDARAADDT